MYKNTAKFFKLEYRIKTEKSARQLRFVPGMQMINPKDISQKLEASKANPFGKLFKGWGAKTRLINIDPKDEDCREDFRSPIQYREQFINLLTFHIISLSSFFFFSF